MTKRTVLSLVTVMGLALPAFAQNAPEAKKPAAPSKPATQPSKPDAKPAQPGEDASQEAWMKAASPGDNHKLLAGMIGTWTAKCKFWMGGPDAPAMESTGTMTSKWVLEGRFVRSEFKGEFMNNPFEGLGYLGYDNVEQKFIGSWMDTMSTNMATSSGTYNAATKTFTMTGKFKDPSTGQNVNNREVTTVVDHNTTKFEMFHAGADGKEHKVGEITYIRAGAAPAGTTPAAKPAK